ncbi:hypothetical protein HY732_03480 [Candidatus Uhrbacteria bacterium]|nr:hypothetical protein [Candidatus Uhrbacteria bacterium]
MPIGAKLCRSRIFPQELEIQRIEFPRLPPTTRKLARFPSARRANRQLGNPNGLPPENHGNIRDALRIPRTRKESDDLRKQINHARPPFFSFYSSRQWRHDTRRYSAVKHGARFPRPVRLLSQISFLIFFLNIFK